METTITITITGDAQKWEDQVPKHFQSRVLDLITTAFEELIDEGVIDVQATKETK